MEPQNLTPDALVQFQAGNGINCNSLNANFEACRAAVNANESSLSTIASTALKKDGSNIEDEAIQKFQETPAEVLDNTLSTHELADNTTYFLDPTKNTTVVLPNVSSDEFSHTVVLIVQGSNYTVTSKNKAGQVITKHLLNDLDVDTTETYCIMYVYNKLDNSWYYNITQ